MAWVEAYGPWVRDAWRAQFSYELSTSPTAVSMDFSGRRYAVYRAEVPSGPDTGIVDPKQIGGYEQYTASSSISFSGTNQVTESAYDDSSLRASNRLRYSGQWTWARGYSSYNVTVTLALTLTNYLKDETRIPSSYYWGPYTDSTSCSVTITVPAKPSYSVSYNANGGTGAPGGQTKWYGENLALSATVPTRPGYAFVSWNTAANGSGTSYSPGATYTGNAGLTLYAIWKELPSILSVTASRVRSDGATSDALGGCMKVSWEWHNTSTSVNNKVTSFVVTATPVQSGYPSFSRTLQAVYSSDVYGGTMDTVFGASSSYYGETVYRDVYPDVQYVISVTGYNANGQATRTYTLNAVGSDVYSRPSAVPTLMRSDAHSNSDICGEYIDVVTAITTYSSPDDSVVVYSHGAEIVDSGWIGDLGVAIDVSPDKKSGHALMGPYEARLLTPQVALAIEVAIADKFYTVTNRHVLPVATAYQLPTIEVTGIRRVAPDGVTEDALGGYLLVTGRYTMTETNTQQQPTASTGKVSAAPGGSALPTVVHFIDDSGPAQSRHDAWEYPSDEENGYYSSSNGNFYDLIPNDSTYSLSKTPNGTISVSGERFVSVPEGSLGDSYSYEPDIVEFTFGTAATDPHLWLSYDGDKTFTALAANVSGGENDHLLRCSFEYEYNEGVPSTTAGTAEGPNTIDARPGRKTAVQTFGELLLSVMRPDEVYYATFTVSDRFNTASTTVQVPVSNYTFPMVYDLEPKRVVMVPDNPALPDGPSHPEPSDDGTDLLVDVSWAIYGSVTQTEPQEFNVTVISEEGQTIVDRDYSLPATTSGQPSELLFKSGDPDISLPVPFSQDLQYIVKVTVMDRYSLAELSSVLTSAFFTLDVKKGGHGIAFGKPATRHVMDVRFPGYFDHAFHIGEQLTLPVYHRLKVPKSALPCLPAIVLVESASGVTTYLAEDGTDILDEPVESEMHTSLSDYDASNGYFHPADYTKPFEWPVTAVSGANPGWYAENDTPSGEHNPYYFTSVQLPVESGKKFYSVIDAYLQTDSGEIMKFVPEPGSTFNDYVVDMDASKPPFSNSGTDISPTGKFFHFKHFEGCGWHSDASSGSVNGTFHVVYEVEDA